jgi:hypothetical protein
LLGGEALQGNTGQVRLADPTGFNLTWNTNPLRDALGYSSNVSGGTTSVVGSNHAPGVWLPSTLGKSSRHGDHDRGKLVSDFRQTVGPVGTVHGLFSQFHYALEGIAWEGVPASRAKEHREVITGESFESFFKAVGLGWAYEFIPTNTLVRLYWNADVVSEYIDGHLLWPPTYDQNSMIPGWVGRYNIALPPLIVET